MDSERIRGIIVTFLLIFHLEGISFGNEEPPPLQISLNEAIERSKESFTKAKILKADRNAQIEKVRGSWADLGPRVKLDYNLTQFEKEMATDVGGKKNVTRPEVVKQGSLLSCSLLRDWVL
jgi:hypothetical protein